jgi:hypothetical protein
MSKRDSIDTPTMLNRRENALEPKGILANIERCMGHR